MSAEDRFSVAAVVERAYDAWADANEVESNGLALVHVVAQLAVAAVLDELHEPCTNPKPCRRCRKIAAIRARWGIT